MRKLAALLIAPALTLTLAAAPASAATGEIQHYRVLGVSYWSPLGSLGVLVNQIPLSPL